MIQQAICSLVGNYENCLEAVVGLESYHERLPTAVWVGNKEQTELEHWQALLLSSNTRSLASWDGPGGNSYQQIVATRGSAVVTFELQRMLDGVEDALTFFEGFPFELAAFSSDHLDAWIAADRPRWGFGGSTVDHGWGCAFRGAAHQRLVSRRWLDFGPWRVIRRPNDTTFVQFYDLTIEDPDVAYAQAAPGHERMGNSRIGGFIQRHIDPLLGKTRGIYVSEERKLEIVVGPGNRVEQFAMHCACAERLHSRLTQPSTYRIEEVAYIFMDRGDAEAHLHELWLRELQCWYMDERGKHRLDLDYHPTPNPPAWVRALDGDGIER